jgi:MFS family permease
VSELHPSVRRLGWISFLNDAAAEMAYPLLPAFLKSLGAGAMALGVLEGFAEATAAFVKIVSGRLGDRGERRKPLIVAGYAVSNLARPLIAFVGSAAPIVALRVIDRFGKGLRTAPRDAYIAGVTPPGRRALAYGFHRGMDHWGGVAGPLLAAALLLVPGVGAREIFILSFVPGLACVALAFTLAAEGSDPGNGAPRVASAEARRPLGRRFWVFMLVQSIFCLAASSDTFLLLRAQELGVPLAALPVLWAAHHGLRAWLSRHGGALADRLSRRYVLAVGWVVYSLAYAGFAVATGPLVAAAMFAVYALFFALSEGAEKALVADLSDATNRGFAFGVFHGLTGALLLAANLMMGVVWNAWGASVALLVSATLSALAAAALVALSGVIGPRAPQAA